MQIKNKKQLLTTLLSVLVSVFLVAGVVYAVTTISATTITLSNGETIANTTDGKIDVTISSTSGSDGFYVQAVSTTGTAVNIRGIRARATGTATATSGSIKGIESTARAITYTGGGSGGGTLDEITAFYGSADAKQGTVGLLRGMEVSLDGEAGGTATLAQGVLISNNSSGVQTTSYALDINSGTPSGHAAFTSDIRLQNGETISNATDGAIDFGTAKIVLGATTTGIEAGASSDIVWTGSSEWLRIFLDNQDTTPGSSAAVIALTNTGDITAGGAAGNSDQIALELKNTLASGTTFSGDDDDHFTGLRTYARLKGNVTGGQVQAIFAELASHTGLTLSAQELRTAYFYTRLQSDPGAGHVSTLELENACGAAGAGLNQEYLDSHISFIGGNSQYLFEFGPSTATTSWSTSGTPGTGAGWLKIKVGGADRWIQLYSVAP